MYDKIIVYFYIQSQQPWSAGEDIPSTGAIIVIKTIVGNIIL